MSLKFKSTLPSIEGEVEWLNNIVIDSDLRGHPVFIQFWAASCGFCLMNSPIIQQWAERYGDQGLKIISVHSPRLAEDYDENHVKKSTGSHKIAGDVVKDNYAVLSTRFQIDQIWPHYFFFDVNHHLRSRAAGMQGLHLVEASIKRSFGLSELANT